MLVSQSVGVIAAVAALAVTGEPAPPSAALVWAGLAGLSGICGIACFYRALSGGPMALIAPLAGVVGAVVPAAVAIVGGEQLSPLRSVGIVAAIGAIVLISLPRGAAAGVVRHALRRQDFALAVLAGLGFAGFYLFLDRSAAVGGQVWWPMLLVRLVGLVAVVAGLTAMVGAGRRSRPGLRMASLLGTGRMRLAAAQIGAVVLVPLFLATGGGDLGGNLFFLLADDHDALAVAVVLSSLYPIVTAILAALLLHERLGRLQIAGVALAFAGAALIGVG